MVSAHQTSWEGFCCWGSLNLMRQLAWSYPQRSGSGCDSRWSEGDAVTGNVASFSFPSCRRLFRYLGEADAMNEITELAARSFLHNAAQSDNIPAFISAASKQHGVCVNLSELACHSHHLARSYIVTVYQSAECFLREFRSEHRQLYRKEWTGDGENIDALTLTLRNIVPIHEDPENRIGRDLIS